MDLVWAEPGDGAARFSLQALDSAGHLLAQVDRRPGRITVAGRVADQVGFATPAGTAALILRAYDASTGEVWPAIPAGGGVAADFVVLAQDPR